MVLQTGQLGGIESFAAFARLSKNLFNQLTVVRVVVQSLFVEFKFTRLAEIILLFLDLDLNVAR